MSKNAFKWKSAKESISLTKRLRHWFYLKIFMNECRKVQNKGLPFDWQTQWEGVEHREKEKSINSLKTNWWLKCHDLFWNLKANHYKTCLTTPAMKYTVISPQEFNYHFLYQHICGKHLDYNWIAFITTNRHLIQLFHLN